jgi:hypothetical protein
MSITQRRVRRIVTGQRAFVSIRRKLDSDLEMVELSSNGDAERQTPGNVPS